MFSCVCSFGSDDLHVPLSPSLKRNTFKIAVRPLRGQSKKGGDRGVFGHLGAAGETHRLFWKVLLYPILASSPGWLPFNLPSFPDLGSGAPR